MPETYLSNQQKQIVELLDDGHTWTSAADELGITESSLEEQMRRVREKREKCEETLDFLDAYGRTGGDTRDTE